MTGWPSLCYGSIGLVKEKVFVLRDFKAFSRLVPKGVLYMKRKCLNPKLHTSKICAIKNSGHKHFYFVILASCMSCVLQTLMDGESVPGLNLIPCRKALELESGSSFT